MLRGSLRCMRAVVNERGRAIRTSCAGGCHFLYTRCVPECIERASLSVPFCCLVPAYSMHHDHGLEGWSAKCPIFLTGWIRSEAPSRKLRQNFDDWSFPEDAYRSRHRQ